MCKTGDPFGTVLPDPVIKVNEKLLQHNSGRMTTGLEPSGMNICVTPPNKETWPAEVFANSTRSTEWVVEKSGHKYQL